MSYNKFHEDFFSRTKELLTTYQGPRDATLLPNCCIGLLLVPREKWKAHFPTEARLTEFGLTTAKPTIAGVACASVEAIASGVRDAIAHPVDANLQPICDATEVVEFRFHSESKRGQPFNVELTCEELRAFLVALSTYLYEQASRTKLD